MPKIRDQIQQDSAGSAEINQSNAAMNNTVQIKLDQMISFITDRFALLNTEIREIKTIRSKPSLSTPQITSQQSNQSPQIFQQQIFSAIILTEQPEDKK